METAREGLKAFGPKAPWEIDASIYLSMKGVHEPWLCEISPYQYARMSERQKRQYDKKRSEEWNASGDCKREWRKRVEAAYRAGIITEESQNLTKEARDVIIYAIMDDENAAEELRKKRLYERNAITDLSELKIGARIFSPLYGYGEVKKINRKTATVRFPLFKPGEFWDTTMQCHMMQWKKTSDIEGL